jgi:hypothetical protein
VLRNSCADIAPQTHQRTTATRLNLITPPFASSKVMVHWNLAIGSIRDEDDADKPKSFK